MTAPFLIDEISVENFRCFRERQVAPLAPLTLLVGDNSTGKTSFQAMVLALTELCHSGSRLPNFKKEPYDLGTFEDIAHHRGGRGGQAESFTGGFAYKSSDPVQGIGKIEFKVKFARDHANIIAQRITIRSDEYSLEVNRNNCVLTTRNGSWTWEGVRFPGGNWLWGVRSASQFLLTGEPQGVAPPLQEEDILMGLDLAISIPGRAPRPFASAPVRSEPGRTYDPSLSGSDPQGRRIPDFLAELKRSNNSHWKSLKNDLVEYGRKLGLFDEFRIKNLGKKGNDPFKVQVRKHGGNLKGPWKDLIDVGYGISQILPLLVEFLRSSSPRLYLLQQPEVHLHPSAQAALGSIMCRMAADKNQLIVETHSDHILDRVRMEVRDGTTGLTPEDVLILYFERNRLSVQIYPIKLDNLGSVIGAPNGYRSFFKQETLRDIRMDFAGVNS